MAGGGGAKHNRRVISHSTIDISITPHSLSLKEHSLPLTTYIKDPYLHHR